MVEHVVVSIADDLDGKRIAVTGSTGFLGTALVERLLRSVPGCELVLLIRPGRRSDPTRRANREIFRNDAFDRLRQDWGDDFQATIDRRVAAVAGDVGTDGLGLDDEGRAALGDVRHRRPLRRHGLLRLPPRPGRRGEPPGPHPHGGRPERAGGHATPGGGVDLLRGRQPPGRRPRGAGRGQRLLHRRVVARRGRRRPSHAHRHRGRQPHPRDAGGVPQAGPGRAGRRRRPPAGREDRAAPNPLGHRPHGRGRSGPRRLAGLARRVRLHQVPRRAGPVREPGRRPGQHRAALDHRVGAGPSRSRAGSVASAWPSR